MPVGIFFSTLETFLSIDEATVNHHCYLKSTKKFFFIFTNTPVANYCFISYFYSPCQFSTIDLKIRTVGLELPVSELSIFLLKMRTLLK